MFMEVVLKGLISGDGIYTKLMAEWHEIDQTIFIFTSLMKYHVVQI